MIPNIKDYKYSVYYKTHNNIEVLIESNITLFISNNTNFDFYLGLIETKIEGNTQATIIVYREKIVDTETNLDIMPNRVKVYEKPFIFKDFDTNIIIDFVDTRVLPQTNEDTPIETKKIFFEIFNKNDIEKIPCEYYIDKVTFNVDPGKSTNYDVYYKKANESEYIKLYTDLVIDSNGNCNIKFGSLTEDTLYDVRFHNKITGDYYNLQFYTNVIPSIGNNKEFSSDEVYKNQLIKIEVDTHQLDNFHSGDIVYYAPLSGHNNVYNYNNDRNRNPVKFISDNEKIIEYKYLKDKYDIGKIGLNIGKSEFYIKEGNSGYVRVNDALRDSHNGDNFSFYPGRWLLFNFYVGEGIENSETDILNFNPTNIKNHPSGRLYVKYNKNPQAEEHDQLGIPELYVFGTKLDTFEVNTWYTIALITHFNNIDYYVLYNGKDFYQYTNDQLKEYGNKFIIYDNTFVDLKVTKQFTKFKCYPVINHEYTDDMTLTPDIYTRIALVVDLFDDDLNKRGRLVETFTIDQINTGLNFDDVIYHNLTMDITKAKFSIIWLSGNGHPNRTVNSISIAIAGDDSSKFHTFRNPFYKIDTFIKDNFIFHESNSGKLFTYNGRSFDHEEETFNYTSGIDLGIENSVSTNSLNFGKNTHLYNDVYIANVTIAETFFSVHVNDNVETFNAFHGYLFNKIFEASRCKLTLNGNIDDSNSIEIIDKYYLYVRANKNYNDLSYSVMFNNDPLTGKSLKLYTNKNMNSNQNISFDIDFANNFNEAVAKFKQLFHVKHHSFYDNKKGVNGNLVYFNRSTKSAIFEIHGDNYTGKVPNIVYNRDEYQYGTPIASNKSDSKISQDVTQVGAMVETIDYLPYGVFKVDMIIPKHLFGSTICLWLNNTINSNNNNNLYFEIGTNVECSVLNENPQTASNIFWDINSLNVNTVCRVDGRYNLYILDFDTSSYQINQAKQRGERVIASNKLTWEEIDYNSGNNPNLQFYEMFNFGVLYGNKSGYTTNLTTKTNNKTFDKNVRQKYPHLNTDKNAFIKFNDGKKHTYTIDWNKDYIMIMIDDHVLYNAKNNIPNNLMRFSIGSYFKSIWGMSDIFYGSVSSEAPFEFANIHISKIKYTNYSDEVSTQIIKQIPDENPYEGNRIFI